MLLLEDIAVVLFPAVLILVAGGRWLRRDLPTLGGTVALVLLLGAGQFSSDAKTYPFIAWSMYSTDAAAAQISRVTIEDFGGQSGTYPFYLLTPWTPGPLEGYSVASPIERRLAMMLARCSCDSGDPQIDLLISSLGRVYERSTGTPIVAVRLERRSVGAPGLSSSWRTEYSWRTSRN